MIKHLWTFKRLVAQYIHIYWRLVKKKTSTTKHKSSSLLLPTRSRGTPIFGNSKRTGFRIQVLPVLWVINHSLSLAQSVRVGSVLQSVGLSINPATAQIIKNQLQCDVKDMRVIFFISCFTGFLSTSPITIYSIAIHSNVRQNIAFKSENYINTSHKIEMPDLPLRTVHV